MAGAIGDYKTAFWRGEISIRDINRDALFAFSAQTVGEKRQVDIIVATALANGFDVLELVFENATPAFCDRRFG